MDWKLIGAALRRGANADLDALEQRDHSVISAFAQLTERVCVPWHQFEMRGIDRYAEGPALVVGNHSGGFLSIDSFLLLNALVREYGVDALPYGLAHDNVIQVRPFRSFLVPLGAIRANPRNAAAIFAAGHKALVYPGGDVDSLRPLARRHEIEFGGRAGYIRTALINRVPIVPVVAGGAHTTLLIFRDFPYLVRKLQIERRLRISRWPLTFSIPWGFTIGPSPPYIPLPTPIIAELLEPIHFERTGPEAARDRDYVRECADLVEGRMQAALAVLGPEAESRLPLVGPLLKARFSGRARDWRPS